jgi:hypothetical protein
MPPGGFDSATGCVGLAGWLADDPAAGFVVPPHALSTVTPTAPPTRAASIVDLNAICRLISLDALKSAAEGFASDKQTRTATMTQ